MVNGKIALSFGKIALKKNQNLLFQLPEAVIRYFDGVVPKYLRKHFVK